MDLSRLGFRFRVCRIWDLGLEVLGLHCWLRGLDIQACISQNRGAGTPPSGSQASLQGILGYTGRMEKKMGTTKSIGGHNIGIMEIQLQACGVILG